MAVVVFVVVVVVCVNVIHCGDDGDDEHTSFAHAPRHVIAGRTIMEIATSAIDNITAGELDSITNNERETGRSLITKNEHINVRLAVSG